MRYTIERKPDQFETLVADSFKVEGGFVLFYQALPMYNSKFIIGFPAHEIVSFFPEDEHG